MISREKRDYVRSALELYERVEEQAQQVDALISDREMIKEAIFRALKSRPINEGGPTLEQKYAELRQRCLNTFGPDMCNAVLDITGDCRDEIVVWDHYKIWVYTQDGSPGERKLYKPIRNSLSNYSNYQATVSLPGWED